MKQNELWGSGTVGCDTVLLGGGGGGGKKKLKGNKGGASTGVQGPPPHTPSHTQNPSFSTSG